MIQFLQEGRRRHQIEPTAFDFAGPYIDKEVVCKHSTSASSKNGLVITVLQRASEPHRKPSENLIIIASFDYALAHSRTLWKGPKLAMNVITRYCVYSLQRKDLLLNTRSRKQLAASCANTGAD